MPQEALKGLGQEKGRSEIIDAIDAICGAGEGYAVGEFLVEVCRICSRRITDR